MAAKTFLKRVAMVASLSAMVAGVTACAGDSGDTGSDTPSGLSGSVAVDGSSTVFPSQRLWQKSFKLRILMSR